MRLAVIAFLGSICLASGTAASAATLTVCASGCAYTDPQAAIDAASPGDTILLRAGQTFVGHLKLRAKSASATSYITIKSDAPASDLPGDGIRLVPSDRPGANTSLSKLPRLVGRGGAYKTMPLIRAEPGAHHYILKFLDVDGTAHIGYETLVELGDDGTSTRPHHITIDRVYIRGHKTKGQKRGIALNGAGITVQNSYIADIKSVSSEGQAIAGWNGPGPFTIVNNYLEGAAMSILFGGAGPAITNLVPSDIEIRRNHLTKPLSWRDPILRAPASASAAARTGGSLASGTHYFKVVAVMTAASATLVSLPSTEVKATVSSSGAVALSWSGVSGAEKYRIYRGTSSGSQSKYLQTSGSGTSLTYTGAGELSGTPPTKASKWNIKNLIEFKNARRVTVDGNIIEHSWSGNQNGYALMLTPRNSSGSASWSTVQSVSFTNNIIRHASGVALISGKDDGGRISGPGKAFTFRNNLMYDIDPSRWGGAPKPFVLVNGPSDVVFDRNTLFHNVSSVVFADGPVIYGFVFTNNIQPHGRYGIMGNNGQPGNYTLTKYFPGANVTYNVFAGGPAANYPKPNAFPTMAEWNASFASISGEDLHLLSTSPFYKAGAGGSAPGANVDAVEAAIGGSSSGDSSSGTGGGGTTSNQAPVADAGGPYAGSAGAAVAVNGSASKDSDGSLVGYRWSWNDDIVIRASQVPASAIKGTRWTKASVSGAADGVALRNPNKGEAKRSSASASPSDYVDVPFYAASGVKYHVWFRMRAESDYYGNDSMFVQFSSSLNSSGSAAWRIGTTSARSVILEEGRSAGLAGWGWNDENWGSLGEPVRFAASGPQTLRLQQREDGIAVDQIVISADKYFASRPGSVRGDATVLPSTLGTTSGSAVTHAFAQAGTYPITLLVTDNGGATDTDQASVSVSSGTLNAPAPSGADIVLRASDFQAGSLVGRWALVADSSAAGGVALENANGQAKIGTAQSSPANYAEVSFTATAGVQYRVWLRMRAASNSYTNDSVFVQFSGSLTSGGAAAYRIGTTSALPVILEEGSGAGLSGWGWNDASYGGLAAPIAFATSGTQRLRIQQREDGLRIDQIVISSGTYFSAAPGALKNDSTIVQR